MVPVKSNIQGEPKPTTVDHSTDHKQGLPHDDRLNKHSPITLWPTSCSNRLMNYGRLKTSTKGAMNILVSQAAKRNDYANQIVNS